MTHPHLSTLQSVAQRRDGNGIYSIGALAAIREMTPYWERHLAEGHAPKIFADDINGLIEQLQIIRDEAAQVIQGAGPAAAVVPMSYLDLSTGHLTEQTMQWVETHDGGIFAMTFAPYTYGAFVSVPDDEDMPSADSGFPEDLLAVLRYARAKGCDVIRFDADGAKVDDLPTFSW